MKSKTKHFELIFFYYASLYILLLIRTVRKISTFGNITSNFDLLYATLYINIHTCSMAVCSCILYRLD